MRATICDILAPVSNYFYGPPRRQTLISWHWLAEVTWEGSSGLDDAAVEQVGVEVDDLKQ